MLVANIVTISFLVGSLEALEFHHQLQSGGQIKAVLVAGSNGYENYRHQADVCHAYQILRANGIPEENIIVMMYDDIAHSDMNPQQGVIINRPDGPNVYQGVKIDYSGKDVTKQNFFNVLNGNKAAMQSVGSGRVLESGPQDNVFVNFVDHGGPGVLLMPEEEIMARELIDVLTNMSSHSRFAKMFLYVEACESGSIFDALLPDNLNIFVMTAADPHESSYACFYDEKLETYLGDVFSVKWMYNAETADLTRESVNHQFQDVRTKTNTSHVEEYGDIDIGVTKVSEVIGYKSMPSAYQLHINDSVSNYFVPIAILGQRIKQAKTARKKLDLQRILSKLRRGRKLISTVFWRLILRSSPANNTAELLTFRPKLTKKNAGCYENMLRELIEKCFSIAKNPFAVSHLHQILNLCNIIPEAELKENISAVCSGEPSVIKFIHGII